MKKIELPVSYGNRKLDGGNTMIYNITSAVDCPSDIEGLCDMGRMTGDGKCYALKAERLYPQTLTYRRRQTKWWDLFFSVDAFCRALKKTTKFFRYNEAGDFRNQVDVDKMAEVCYAITEARTDVACYGYTRRSDLDLRDLSVVSNVVVGGGVELPACSSAEVVSTASEASEGWFVCPGKHCMTKCCHCAMRRNGRVSFVLH